MWHYEEQRLVNKDRIAVIILLSLCHCNEWEGACWEKGKPILNALHLNFSPTLQGPEHSSHDEKKNKLKLENKGNPVQSEYIWTPCEFIDFMSLHQQNC